jgi:hypothetical protein
VHILRGQESGFVKRDVDALQAAHFIVLLHEGLFGMLKGLGDPVAFHAFFASITSYLRSIEAPGEISAGRANASRSLAHHRSR